MPSTHNGGGFFLLRILLLLTLLYALPLTRSQTTACPLCSDSSPPSTPTLSSQLCSLSDVDRQLLAELDVLIELQQRKVQLLTDIQRHQHTLSVPSPFSDSVLSPSLPAPSAPTSVHPPLSTLDHTPPRPPPPPPKTSPTWSVTHFLSRASIFLVAIGVTIVWQHFQRSKRRLPPPRSAPQSDHLQRALRLKRLHASSPGLRRRVHAEGAQGMETVVYGGEDELREDELTEAGVLDEGVGDFWDAGDAQHDTYQGVLGVDDTEEGTEGDDGEGLGTSQELDGRAEPVDTVRPGTITDVHPLDDEDDAYDEDDDEDEW